ncbi:hypothetical protein ABEV38_19140 [Parageobacillus thermoglucosidasius]|uniref:hypothetical protein n=1 Tax=Parageobacillus thermoglucosidasius TaxID=1426 RepID=UPI003D2B914A
MILGISLIIIGVILLPFGMISLKESWEEKKDLSLKKKMVVIFLEILDIFSTPILSTWLLGLSLLMIIGGLAVILLKM